MAADVGMIEVLISKDNMQALARINPDGEAGTWSEKKLLATLTAQSVEVTEEVRDRVQLMVEQLRTGTIPVDDVLLAEGVLPKLGVDGRVEWPAEADPTRTDYVDEDAEADVVDHYARSSIISASEGDLVCTVIPPVEGEPGRDVCGREVPPPKVRRAPIQFNDTLVHGKETGRVTAAISGRVNLGANRAWLSPLLVIHRNVNFQVGNIDFDGDVLIKGNVLDLFKVTCTKSLVVKGMIEAAHIDCQGDLTVAGGIAGKEKAVITVGGKVAARFIDNATVHVGGGAYVQKELVNSTVVTGQQLVTPGAITACNIDADGGVKATDIGSRSGIPTKLVVGSSRDVFRRLSRLDRELSDLDATVGGLRSRLGPLLQRHRALPEKQKLIVLKLLEEVKKGMNRLDELKQEKKELQEIVKANREACIKVGRFIHQGTTVQIGRAVATLRDTLKGPLQLVSHMVDGTPRVAACSPGGRAVILESYK